ncbi:probable plastid-lipid-associated protein 4, chloroplastic isoform X2 [Jatropha curcas]|uniref:probable plastid-lipid-associated protein 4, chloroplastic isoform X2 n=1 Tax=Jatropha curcas TaxID=180498 RepID=UPI0009D76AFD|nr:probable plastid-lipid-associated protein 4, chloroplastic isoform X2 [Jatropha curcas]
MAATASAANLKTLISPTELLITTSHPPQTILSSKFISLSSKPNTHTEISSNKNKIYDAVDSWKWRTRVSFFQGLLKKVNKVKEPLKSNLLNGKWELIYTTSQSVLQTKRPKLLRPNGKIYQAINVDTLRAQNMETWPFFNQVTANLVPINARRVAVKFDFFRIAGLIPIASPGSGRGQLEITYLDDELRISRGDRGNLFILKMVDPSYRVPL